jgi:hypothetical protein
MRLNGGKHFKHLDPSSGRDIGIQEQRDSNGGLHTSGRGDRYKGKTGATETGKANKHRGERDRKETKTNKHWGDRDRKESIKQTSIGETEKRKESIKKQA